MIKTHYIKARTKKNTIPLDMQDMKRGRKPEKLTKPPIMSQVEKEARIYDVAKKLGVKIGGAE